ncbi:MAG: Ldh family oxidoreductase [Planctomycetales bacterium]|nr:Ldh family oxidoreductase [Planctomycetales bacterium]
MSNYLINATELREFVNLALRRVGYSESDAEDAASILIWASLRGVDTHGIRNLVSYYVETVRSGQIDPQAKLVITRETQHAVRINGNSSTGLVATTHAARAAIQKANETGVGLAAVYNSHHLGPAGFYANLAIEHAMLGLCASGHFFGRGFDIGVAPINGLRAMLSTNPFAFAAPCGTKPPFVLDMSTAVTTVNRIQSYGQAERPIPNGWAKDLAGQPTNDPNIGTILFPLGGETETGGHKGVGLSMMVSILSGVLSGAWANCSDGSEYDQPTMGHFVAAIRIADFMPVEEFTAAMDAFVTAIQSSDRLNADEPIHYPGSQEHATAIARTKSGIPIDERLRNELRLLAESLSISGDLFG